MMGADEEHSDEETETTEREPEPAPQPAERAFVVIPLSLGATGELSFKMQRHVLPTKVYDRSTAMKYAAHEARRWPGDSPTEMLYALINPSGRCVGVLAGGTGKAVRPIVALRVRKALVANVPELVKMRRRTSRVPSRSVARVGRRRTSRARRAS